MLDADLPLDAEKAADLANRLLVLLYNAELNRFEAITALALVTAEVFQDVPSPILKAWIKTLRLKAKAANA